MTSLKTLLIGDNGFIGVNHLSQDKARQTKEKLTLEKIPQVIEKAVSCGASGFTFSTHPINFQVLKALQKAEDFSQPLELYPILPYAEGYVRLVNEQGMVNVAKEMLSKLPLSAGVRSLFEGTISALTFDPIRMLNAYVDMELASYLEVRPATCSIRSVLLHEIIVDLGIAFGADHLFRSFMKHVMEKYKAQPGFVTRNFSRFVEFCKTHELPLRDVIIMTPFNKVGFQMNPSKEACETSLRSLTECKVIAMSFLAAGYLTLDEAVDYIRSLDSLSGVAVGVSSESHAESTFGRLSEWARHS